MNQAARFDPEEIKAFEAEAKVGLLATVSPEGLPHVTLISSIQAKDPARLIWGQFCEGLSKEHVKQNPRTGFLIMTLEKELWRGKALWTHLATEGDEYEMFNRKPMFRYNPYFGIHTVHFMDLVQTNGKERLPLGRITLAALATKAAKTGRAMLDGPPVLNPWTRRFFDRLDVLKFIATLEDDGFPRLVPLIQCQAADDRWLAFSPLAYGDELAALRQGATVAVFALSTSMEDVLVRGTFLGYHRSRLQRLGIIEVNWVYNSMPPTPGQIYPPLPLEPIDRF